MIPLYGFLRGDTLGLLVLARETDTVATLGERLQQAARLRVRPRADVRVVYRGRVLDPKQTLAAAKVRALDRFDVVPADAPLEASS